MGHVIVGHPNTESQTCDLLSYVYRHTPPIPTCSFLQVGILTYLFEHHRHEALVFGSFQSFGESICHLFIRRHVSQFNKRTRTSKHDPCMRHWRGLQHLLRYLATFPKEGIHFEREEKSQGYQMKGYSDADFAGDVEIRRSCAGYVLFLGETPISWSSKTESQTCDLLSYVYRHRFEI